MLKIYLNLLIILLILVNPVVILAQQSAKSQPVNTQVGNPTDPAPGVSTPSGPRPTAPEPQGDLRQEIISKFGITMNGFGQQHLKWAWEKFWDVSNTQFNELTRGTVIAATSGTASQTGCKTVNLGQYSDQTLFKIVLTHELGHIIYWCNDESKAKKRDHQNVFATEGGVTGYGASGCLGTPAVTEDYAEMIAYYLNQGVDEQTASCNNRRQIPYGEGKNTLHFNLANSILGAY